MNKLIIFVVLILSVVILVQFAQISQQKTEIKTLQQELETSSNNLNRTKIQLEEESRSHISSKNLGERKVQGLLADYIHEKTSPETLNSYSTMDQYTPDLNPVNGSYKLSQKFGSEHKALDFAASTGTEVIASASGKIISVKYDHYFGEMIIIQHNNEYKTLYAHLSKILVKENISIKKGDVIGLVGNSGNSTASHLHFEIMKRDKNIDPAKILKKI